MGTLLECKNLSKRYEKGMALSDLEPQIRKRPYYWTAGS